jgi:hypothetical protein
MQTVKEKFIRDLINELNDINHHAVDYEGQSPKVDVPYVVSVIDQQLDKCTEFLEDISKNTYCINGFDEDTTDGYTNGRIRILIEKPQNEEESEYMYDSNTNYIYYINFLYDQRNWGYCQCTPDMEGYNEEHECCGCGCDWYAPSFSIEKVTTVGYGVWEGQERDYWDYKKKFLTNEQNNKEELVKILKEQEKKRLEGEIKALQNKLNSLND